MNVEGVAVKKKLLGLLGGISIFAAAVQPAAAGTITLAATGTDSDGPLAASALFTTSLGQISVTLTNDLSASVIRSAGQTVSDLSFTLSNAPGTLGTTSATGTFATFNGSTTPTLAAGNPIRWLGAGGQGSFSIIGNTITLEAIGGGQPSQLILPTGTTYSNANASITGGQFSPFLDGPITFTLALSGVTANTTITGNAADNRIDSIGTHNDVGPQAHRAHLRAVLRGGGDRDRSARVCAHRGTPKTCVD